MGGRGLLDEFTRGATKFDNVSFLDENEDANDLGGEGGFFYRGIEGRKLRVSGCVQKKNGLFSRGPSTMYSAGWQARDTTKRDRGRRGVVSGVSHHSFLGNTNVATLTITTINVVANYGNRSFIPSPRGISITIVFYRSNVNIMDDLPDNGVRIIRGTTGRNRTISGTGVRRLLTSGGN